MLAATMRLVSRRTQVSVTLSEDDLTFEITSVTLRVATHGLTSSSFGGPTSKNGCTSHDDAYVWAHQTMSSSRRSFDSRPLTRSAESRREQCRALRADMRRSTVWRKCLATLSSLCLLQGYTRPVGRTEAWLVQHFLVPGHSASSPAARAADVASHFAEAFRMTHPRQRMEADLDPACRATIEWQCAAHLRGDDIRVLRNARLSAITQCARDLEGWSRALEELAPSWLQGFQAPATSSRSLRPRLRGMPATQHRPGRRPGLWHPGRWRMPRLWGFSPRWAAERGVHRRPRPRCMAR
jgi:hypothetical protein